jgi:hypothetical protein
MSFHLVVAAMAVLCACSAADTPIADIISQPIPETNVTLTDSNWQHPRQVSIAAFPKPTAVSVTAGGQTCKQSAYVVLYNASNKSCATTVFFDTTWLSNPGAASFYIKPTKTAPSVLLIFEVQCGFTKVEILPTAWWGPGMFADITYIFNMTSTAACPTPTPTPPPTPSPPTTASTPAPNGSAAAVVGFWHQTKHFVYVAAVVFFVVSVIGCFVRRCTRRRQRVEGAGYTQTVTGVVVTHEAPPVNQPYAQYQPEQKSQYSSV